MHTDVLKGIFDNKNVIIITLTKIVKTFFSCNGLLLFKYTFMLNHYHYYLGNMSTIVKEDVLDNLESSGLIIPYSHLRLLDCVGQGMYCTHMTIIYIVIFYI